MVTVKPYNESWHLTETAYDVPSTVLIPADLETGNPDIAHGYLVAPVSLTENVFIPLYPYLQATVFAGYIPENLLDAYELFTGYNEATPGTAFTSMRLGSPVLQVTSCEKPYSLAVPMPAAPMPLPEKLTRTFKDAVEKGGVYTLTGTCNITKHAGKPYTQEEDQSLVWLTWRQADSKDASPIFDIVTGRLDETMLSSGIGVTGLGVDIPQRKSRWGRKPPIEEAGAFASDYLITHREETGWLPVESAPEGDVVYAQPFGTEERIQYYTPIVMTETEEFINRCYETRTTHLYAPITEQERSTNE